MQGLIAFVLCLLACLSATESFSFVPLTRTSVTTTTTSLRLSESDNQPPSPPRNLVDKDLFVAAVDTLRTEMAKQQDDNSSQPPQSQAKDPNDFFAIGKVSVNLDISSGNPGMDLAESAGGLVLVSTVTGLALQAGIQTGDTIVGVRAAGAYQETRQFGLEDTARVLMGAMKLSLENGSSEIQLELNRLIKMRYA